MKNFAFPKGFVFGAATASLQIEGGDRNNSWYRWAETGHIKDGSHCITACDHWNRVGEDIALMKDLGLGGYRMSLEWSRIEPRPGVFDDAALARYRAEIEGLLLAGIRPLVTLHHFSNPLWFEDSGGWLRKDAPAIFVRYAERAVRALGDLVTDWITINEPNIYLAFGYLTGDWPPGEKSMGKYLKGAGRMIAAHRLAYRAIHHIRGSLDGAAGGKGTSGRNGAVDGKGSATRVGAAHHIRLYDPAWNPLTRLVAALYDRLSQGIFLSGMTGPADRGVSPGETARARYADFLGVNYYTRDMVGLSFDPGMLFGRRYVRPGAAVNDLGWEIYPEGLYRIGKRLARDYPGLPIIITENGTADGADAFRAGYLYDHLYQTSRLIGEGVPVEGYYHWTLMDNFEWIEGFSARFGLYHTDFATQKRRLRRSGELYREFCRNRGFTEGMQGYL
jgi:beta-glucosidase